MIKGKLINSLRDCRSYSRPDLNLDHRIVTAKVKISYRVTKSKTERINIDYTALSKDPELQMKYSLEVSNRFQELARQEANDFSAQKQYDDVLNIIDEVSKEVLPIKRNTTSLWVSAASEKLIQDRRNARNRY